MEFLRRLKFQKYRKWETYLALVQQMNPKTFLPLLEEPTVLLKPPETDNLFQMLPMHQKLCAVYQLERIAEDKMGINRVICIMQWLTDNTYYNGASPVWHSDNSLELLSYSYKKKFSHALNCREKAIVFCDCLLAIGILSLPVMMCDSQCENCHFVVHVFIEELQKWVLFDPSFNCYFTYDNMPLDIWQLKKLFLSAANPVLNGYSFNHTAACQELYLQGFIKQLLTNVSTWEDNSMLKRDGKKYDWSSKKEFNRALPEFIN